MLFAPSAAQATEYYRIGTVTDPGGESSLSGTSSATGWSTSSNSQTVATRGITVANSVYYFWRNSAIRTPQARTTFSTPQSSSIVVLPDVRAIVGHKSGLSTLTFNNVLVSEGATFRIQCNSGPDADYRAQIGGSFDLAAGAALTLASTGSDNGFETFDLAATVNGSGRIVSELINGGTTIRSAAANGQQRISGDISGFAGDVEVYRTTLTYPGELALELVNAQSIPGNPPDGTTSYVVVTNGATLKIDQNWISPRNRVWDFGNGAPPTIYVAAGRTVTINGEVRGSVGFRKSGPGMLVLTKRGALSGTCEVLSGKVRLEGGAAAFRSLFRQKNALSLPSDYTMLDYIDLSGANTNSCIDTGYVPKDQDFGFMLDTSLSGLPTSLSYWFMGSSWLSSTSPYFYGIGCSTKINANDCLQLNFGYSGTSRSYWPMRSPEISNGTRFRMSLLTRQGESSLGESHAFEKGLSYNFSGSVFVGFINFTSSSSLSREKTQPMHIYRFKLFDGNTLVHDFVPVARKSDGLLGLYDTFGDKGFRRVFDQSCSASGGAYSGSDSVWIEVEPGPGSVYYIR